MVLPVILPTPDTDFEEENSVNKSSNVFDPTSRHLGNNDISTDQKPKDILVANNLEINSSDELQSLEDENKMKLCKQNASDNNKGDNLGTGKFKTSYSNKRKLIDDAESKTLNSHKRMKKQSQNSDRNFLDFHVMSDLKNKQQGCWKSSLPNTGINDVYSFECDESAGKEEKSLDKTVLHKRRTNAAGGMYDKPARKTSCTYTEKQPKDSKYLIDSPLHFDSEVTPGKHLEIELDVSENKTGILNTKTLALGGVEKPTNGVGEDLHKHSITVNEFNEAINNNRTSKSVLNLEQQNIKDRTKNSKTSESDRNAVSRNDSEPFEPWKDMYGGFEYCKHMASNVREQSDIKPSIFKANKIRQNLEMVKDFYNSIGTPSNVTCKIKGCLCTTAVNNSYKNNDLPILPYNPVLFQPTLNSVSLIDSSKFPNRTEVDGLCETGWYRPRQSVIDRRLEAIRKVSLWIGDCQDQSPEDKQEPVKLSVPSKGPAELKERRKSSKLASKNVKSKCAVSDQIKCAVSKTLSKNKCAVNTKQNCAPDESNGGVRGKESAAVVESLIVSGKDTRKEKVADQPGLLQNTNNSQRNDNKFEYPVDLNYSLPARNVKDVFAFQPNEELYLFTGVGKEHCSRTHLFPSFKKANNYSEDVTKLKCASFNDKHSVSSILRKETSSKIVKLSHSVVLEIEKERMCTLESEKVRKTEEQNIELQNNSFAESKEVLHQKLVLNNEQTNDRVDNILDLTVRDRSEQNKHGDKMFVDRDNKYIHSGAELGEIGNCVNTDITVKELNLVSDVKSRNSELLTKDFVEDFKINIVNAVEHEKVNRSNVADRSIELGTKSNKEFGIKYDSNKETSYTYKSPFNKSNNTMEADEIDDAEDANSLNLNLEDFNQAYKESIETVQSLRDIDTLADNDNIIGNVIIQDPSCKVSHGFRPDVVLNNSSKELTTKEVDQTKVNSTITTKLGTGSVDIKKYLQEIIKEDNNVIEDKTKDTVREIVTNTGEQVGDLQHIKQEIENPDRIKLDLKQAGNFSYDLALQECELESENYPEMMDTEESGQKLLENFADIEPSLGISDQNSTVANTQVLPQDALTSFQMDSLRELKFLNDLNPILDSSSTYSNMYKPTQHGFNVSKGGNSVSLSDPNSVSDDLVSMNSNSEANSFTLDDALVGENTGEDYQWNNMLKSFILQNLENEPNSENKPNGTKMTESTSVDVKLLLEQKLAEQYLNRNIESLKRQHSEDF